MRLWMALLAMVPACGFSSGNGNGGDGGGPDALVCYGSFVRVCFSTPPMAPVMLTASTDIDTDGTALCDQENDQKSSYCVVAGNGFTIAANQTITAHGSRPLVLLSTAMFDLSGSIDVSSNRSRPQKGPGADPADCVSGTPPTGSSGGYGGSFQGKGGNGSDGNPDDGSGGVAAAKLATFPSALRGGCPGGSAIPMGAGGEGAGGSGGGAIAIIAAQLNVGGKINASGEGGRGGPAAKRGGGGGGSGGMIVLDLDASMIQLGSKPGIWANGGGGAQGGAIDTSGLGGTGGVNGNESTAPDQGAAATSGSTNGADGGAGSVGATLTGADGRNNAANSGGSDGGGGGGGGGAGFVHAPGVMDPAVISPPSLDLPALPL